MIVELRTTLKPQFIPPNVSIAEPTDRSCREMPQQIGRSADWRRYLERAARQFVLYERRAGRAL